MEVAARARAGEYPLPRLVLPHVFRECLAGGYGKKRVPVLSPFARAYVDEVAEDRHPPIQTHGFTHAEAAAINQHEQGAVFWIADSREQATHLIATHHRGQLAFFPGSWTRDLEVSAMEYVSREESESADGLILIRSRTAAIDAGQ